MKHIKLQTRNSLHRLLDIGMTALGVFSGVVLISEIGFHIPPEIERHLPFFVHLILTLFIVQECLRWLLIGNAKEYARQRTFEAVILFLLALSLFFPSVVYYIFGAIIPGINPEQATLAYLTLTELGIIGSLLIKGARYNSFVAKLALPPGALLLISFVLVILIGTLLLLMPKATTAGISFADALFTATSAVCVTGLIVVDTATAFSPLGHSIILLLIQIGGLGVMTITTFFAMFFTGGISIRERLMMSTVFSESNLGDVSKLLLRIIIVAFSIEIIGAVSLYLSSGGSFVEFSPQLFFISVFHSVSAFCNAGFSLYSDGLAENVVANNYLHHTFIMILVVIGGIGFGVFGNTIERLFSRVPRNQRKLSLMARLVWLTTISLVLVRLLFAFLLEYNGAFSEMRWWEALFQSLFLSVTSRTAGFNILPMEVLSPVVLLPMMGLMWIGASPGSTGGGIKTTTFAVALLNVIDTIQGKHRLEIFQREIHSETARTALSIILLSLFLLGGASTLLLVFEPQLPPIALLFECVSALSTVGLSYNITGELSGASRALVIVLMVIGRVGVLTFALAFVKPQVEENYRYPAESVAVM